VDPTWSWTADFDFAGQHFTIEDIPAMPPSP
jgi:hypothetical protein